MKMKLTSCFGLGLLPIAPGTWGSLPPAIIFVLMCYSNTPTIFIAIVMAALALIGSIICITCSPAIILAMNNSDPGIVVVDEVAGQAVTFLFVLAVPTYRVGIIQSIASWFPCPICISAIIAFLLFRAFDIIKPWPIYQLQKLPEGWGILADDLLAGVYAGICIIVLYFIFK